MENFNMSKHTSFYAVGLSYKKADAQIRGKFSLDAKAKSTLLMQLLLVIELRFMVLPIIHTN